MNFSVIIPARNEENNIERVIMGIEQNIENKYEIIVVNDHSTDKTVEVVKRLALQYDNIYLVHNTIEPGFTNVLRTGFNNANTELIVPVMADFCDDPKTIDKMYEKVLEGFDIVCGSRYMKGGKRLGGIKTKAFFSFFVGLISHILLGIPTHDITNSFKMYKKNVLNNIIMNSTGFEISMEITLEAYFKNFRITEIPTIWKERESGESKFNPFKNGPGYLKLYLRAVRKKIKDII